MQRLARLLHKSYENECNIPFTDSMERAQRRNWATVEEIDASARLLTRKQVIQLASDLAEENAISTLLHEILEALNFHLALKLEHKIIMALEAGLFQVLVDNGVDLSPLEVE